ncbi:MAG: APC family permease, partial [Dongiaceae bacterium]
VRYIEPANWQPFLPYGYSGVLQGSAYIFFAYIGFDSVSTHAEEARRPNRDVPIGIVTSLIICTVLYILVVAVLTGMVPYDRIDTGAGVSVAFKEVGLGWAEVLVAIAGVAGITSVLLVMMLSAPRVFLAMARDGMVPPSFFAAVHPKFRTPWKSTLLVGAFVATATGFLPIDALLQMTNIGTLFAFAVVCAAVLIMRRTNPEAARPFRCPWVPVVPVLGMLSCLLLMLSLPTANWWRLIGWMAIGLVIYFAYSRHRTVMTLATAEELARYGASPGETIDKAVRGTDPDAHRGPGSGRPPRP